MRVACIDSDAWGYALSWWLRLQDEGADVRVYIDNEKSGEIGKGLVTLEPSYDRIISWAKERPEETLVLFCQSGLGEKADDLRKSGLYVVGGGKFCDKLETDRQFGFDVAAACGMQLPGFQGFKSLSDGIRAREADSAGGVFKSDDYLESDATQVCTTGEALVEYMKHLRERFKDRVKFIVQDLVGGKDSADFDIMRWWDGSDWVGPYELTIEKKRFGNGELGPSTGCATNAIWWSEEPAFADNVDWTNLAEIFRSQNASPGPYALNTRISDDDESVYFLEWTPRMGFDSEPTSALLIDSLSDFLWRVGTGQGSTAISHDLAYSVRLSVPPYPHETVDAKDEHSALGVPLPNDLGNMFSPPFVGYQVAREPEGLYVASPIGIVGLACATGNDLKAMGEEVNEFVSELHKDVSKIMARTDGANVIRKDAEKLEALGVDVHPALLKEESSAKRSA